MTPTTLTVDGREYQPIPASWIAVGTDAGPADADLRLYAVSATSADDDHLRIRYTHAKKPGVLEAIAPAVPNPADDGLIPSGYRDGSWARSIAPVGDARPTGHIHEAEARHLRRLWGDRVSAVPTDEDVRRTIADGGLVADTITDLQQTHLSPIDFEEAY